MGIGYRADYLCGRGDRRRAKAHSPMTARESPGVPGPAMPNKSEFEIAPRRARRFYIMRERESYTTATTSSRHIHVRDTHERSADTGGN